MMVIQGLVQRKIMAIFKMAVSIENMTAKAFIILAIKKALSTTCSK